jgi:hypothetical protein
MLRTRAFLVVFSVSVAAWAQTADPSTPAATAAPPSVSPPATALPATKEPVKALPLPTNDCTTVLPQAECAVSRGRAATIRIARIGVELVFGTLLGAALGAGGAYAGLNADLAGGKESGVGLGVGTSLGVALGVAPGVWLGGWSMGGDGSFGWTLLGSAAGTGLSAALLAIDDKPGLLFIAATIPVSTSILAYELSSHTRKRAKLAPTAAKVTPALGPTFVGVVGTF